MVGKEEIVARIAQKSGLTKKAVNIFMDAFKEVLIETLANGEIFHLHKIFTMKVVHKGPRLRHNPQTLEPVEVSACEKIKTIIGSELEVAVNTKNKVCKED